MLAIRIFNQNILLSLNRKSSYFSLLGYRYISYYPKHNSKSSEFLKNEVLKYNVFRNVSSLAAQSISNLELEEYKKAEKIIYNDLTQSGDKMLVDVDSWYAKMFDYNLTKGKKVASRALIDAYRNLSNDVTSEGLVSACILAWCVELLLESFNMADDIMDQSETRRGQPCWYKKPEVGLMAVNDVMLLQCGVFKILKNHFGKSELYFKFLHEFIQGTEHLAYGQCMDMLAKPINSKPKFENFTMEKYRTLINYKTSSGLYVLPVNLAMHLAGRKLAEDFETVKQFCLNIGLLYNIQNDYFDCYGNTEVYGNPLGNDISGGKCSWLAVKFLENASDSLKNEWRENYGIKKEECISKVMLCYDKVNLKNKYKVFEEQLYSKISSMISTEISSKPMQNIFSCILNTNYKRDK